MCVMCDARERMPAIIENAVEKAKYDGTREVIGRFEIEAMIQSNENAIESHPILIEVYDNVDHAVCFNGTCADVTAYLKKYLV